jgi:hypothetical protein
MSLKTKSSLEGTCHDYVAGISTPYDYVPSLAAGIAFCALFGISMLAHVYQGYWAQMWWCYVFSIGCLGKL